MVGVSVGIGDGIRNRFLDFVEKGISRERLKLSGVSQRAAASKGTHTNRQKRVPFQQKQESL